MERKVVTEAEAVIAQWELALHDVEKTHPLVWAFAKLGTLVTMTRNEVILGYHAHQNQAISRMREDAASVALGNAMSARCKRPIQVKVICFIEEETPLLRGVKYNKKVTNLAGTMKIKKDDKRTPRRPL